MQVIELRCNAVDLDDHVVLAYFHVSNVGLYFEDVLFLVQVHLLIHQVVFGRES